MTATPRALGERSPELSAKGGGGTPGPGRTQRGAVLVAVLLALVAIGAIVVAMSLEASLTSLSARSASGAAQARPAARAALVVAVHELVNVGAEGLAPEATAALGADVSFQHTVDASVDPPVHSLRVVALVGRSRAEASAKLVLEPEARLLEWR